MNLEKENLKLKQEIQELKENFQDILIFKQHMK